MASSLGAERDAAILAQPGWATRAPTIALVGEPCAPSPGSGIVRWVDARRGRG